MNPKEFKSVTDPEGLRQLGTLADLKQALNEIVSPLTVEADSYEALYQVLQRLKEKWSDLMEGPFIDQRAEYTFYLTELEGKQRNRLLGITDALYDSPEAAKQWYRNIAKLVHPDTGPDDTGRAFRVLEQLYRVMTDSEEDDAHEGT